jgi:NitT/TauT family transport system substrate-binding protein
MNPTRRHLLILPGALALGTAGSHAQSRSSSALERVIVAGWSKPITEITNLLAEPDKGFFRAYGIELGYVPGAGGGDAIRNLLSGQADVAFTDPGSFFAALAKGEKLRAIYDIYPQNVFNVVALKSSGIVRPADLRGRKVGVYSLASATRLNLQLLLQQVGLSERDVSIQITGLLNFAPLIQGQVDATAATDTGLLVARRRGLKDFNLIEVRDHLNYSSDLFVLREPVFESKKDLFRRFTAAYRESARWMMAEPAEAARIATRRAIDGQDPALNLEIIQARNASSVSELTRTSGLGTQDIDSLQKAADAYYRLGLIDRRLQISDFVSNELLA